MRGCGELGKRIGFVELMRNGTKESDACVAGDIELASLSDVYIGDHGALGGVVGGDAVGANAAPERADGCRRVLRGRDAEHGAGEHERGPGGVAGIRGVLREVDVSENDVVGIGGVSLASDRVVTSGDLVAFVIDGHIAVASLAGLDRNGAVISRSIVVAERCVGREIRVTVVDERLGGRIVLPAIPGNAQQGARLLANLGDTPNGADDLLVATDRTELLLGADEDVGLAVDGLGYLALEVAAGELRQVLGGVGDGGGVLGGLGGGLVGCRGGVRGSGGIGGRGIGRGCGGVDTRGGIGVGDAIR